MAARTVDAQRGSGGSVAMVAAQSSTLAVHVAVAVAVKVSRLITSLERSARADGHAKMRILGQQSIQPRS
jgi:hypothetical protein